MTSRICRSGYGRLAPYLVRQWLPLSAIVALTLASALTAAAQPWPMKLLVDHALKHEALPEWLQAVFGSADLRPITLAVIAAAASLGVFSINVALDVGLNWTWALAGQRMVYGLSTDLFDRLQRLSLQFHRRNPVGDSLSRLSTDSWCVYSLSAGVLAPAQHAATLVTVSLVAWRMDPQLAGASFVLAPLLAVSSYLFGRRMKHRARQGREAQARLLSFVQQTFSAIPVIQAFSTEQQNWRRFQTLASDAVALSQRSALVNSTYGLANGFILTCGTALILWLGGMKVLAGAMSLGTLLVFLAYIRNLQGACEGLLKTYGALKGVEASIDRVVEVLDQRDAVTDAPDASGLPARTDRGIRVEIDNVTFGYEPDKPVLNGVSIELGAGETVAVVGLTGAGKSTLAALLLRFFDPWTGRVAIDGIDLRSLKLGSVRAAMAVVLQEPYLFAASVAENIAYGRPGASREEIAAAAVAANADSFIRRLPQGYDTVIGQRGATLSGGERQRIAIARALLRDSPLLILDEPTSALDANSEAMLLDALDRLKAGRTALIIAHRLSTIRNADRIVVLEDGRVVESGSPGELLARDGVYHVMHSLQSAVRKGAA